MVTLEEKVDLLISKVNQLLLLESKGLTNLDRSIEKKRIVEEIEGIPPSQKVYEFRAHKDIWIFMAKAYRKYNATFM